MRLARTQNSNKNMKEKVYSLHEMQTQPMENSRGFRSNKNEIRSQVGRARDAFSVHSTSHALRKDFKIPTLNKDDSKSLNSNRMWEDRRRNSLESDMMQHKTQAFSA